MGLGVGEGEHYVGMYIWYAGQLALYSPVSCSLKSNDRTRVTDAVNKRMHNNATTTVRIVGVR